MIDIYQGLTHIKTRKAVYFVLLNKKLRGGLIFRRPKVWRLYDGSLRFNFLCWTFCMNKVGSTA